jgi:hypothetical protein
MLPVTVVVALRIDERPAELGTLESQKGSARPLNREWVVHPMWPRVRPSKASQIAGFPALSSCDISMRGSLKNNEACRRALQKH